MQRGPHVDPIQKLIQGQVPTVLTTSREDSRDGTVTFRIGSHFLIIATEKGVAFAGSSVNFNHEMVADLHKIIRWADKCAKDLAAGMSAPLQMELMMQLRLRTKRYANGTFKAWYEGHFDEGVSGPTGDKAVRALRTKWRLGEHGTITNAKQLQK